MSKLKATLKLTNCLQCPHHKQITSKYTDDSFDMVDVDTVCTLAKGKVSGAHETLKGRAISVSDRPWQAKANCDIPKWCPLLKEKSK